MGCLITLFAAGLALGTKLMNFEMDPALVGLSLSYAIGITNSLNWIVIQSPFKGREADPHSY